MVSGDVLRSGSRHFAQRADRFEVRAGDTAKAASWRQASGHRSGPLARDSIALAPQNPVDISRVR